MYVQLTNCMWSRCKTNKLSRNEGKGRLSTVPVKKDLRKCTHVGCRVSMVSADVTAVVNAGFNVHNVGKNGSCKWHTSDFTGCTNLWWTLKAYVAIWPTVEFHAANCIGTPAIKVMQACPFVLWMHLHFAVELSCWGKHCLRKPALHLMSSECNESSLRAKYCCHHASFGSWAIDSVFHFGL